MHEVGNSKQDLHHSAAAPPKPNVVHLPDGSVVRTITLPVTYPDGSKRHVTLRHVEDDFLPALTGAYGPFARVSNLTNGQQLAIKITPFSAQSVRVARCAREPSSPVCLSCLCVDRPR
eukprot:m.603709 g.603709  ORF g.603709 m.603709 type:complete len:118 (-) comp58103_c1_seq12:1480-1833(-)